MKNQRLDHLCHILVDVAVQDLRWKTRVRTHSVGRMSVQEQHFRKQEITALKISADKLITAAAKIEESKFKIYSFTSGSLLQCECLPTDYVWIVVPALALRRKGMLAGICSSLHAHTMTTSCDHHEWKHLPTFRLSRQSEKERLQRSIQTLIGNLSKCLNALP